MRDDTLAKIGRVAWPANATMAVVYYLFLGWWQLLAFAIFCGVIATLQTTVREWPLEDDAD